MAWSTTSTKKQTKITSHLLSQSHSKAMSFAQPEIDVGNDD